MKKINDLENLGKKYRYELLEKVLLMKVGHIGSIFSMMDIVVAMYHGGFVRYNTSNKSFDDKATNSIFDQGKLLKQSCFTGNIKQLVIRTFLISHKIFNIKKPTIGFM